MVMNGIQESQKSESAQNVKVHILTGKRKRIDLTGQKFGRLTVIDYAGTIKKGKSRQATWHCKCSCGNDTTVRTGDLRNGHTLSCGCLGKEKRLKANTSHGMRHTLTYEVWGAMKARCSNPNCSDFNNYGSRGIKVCKRWLKFENFLEDMGEKPKGLTLERKDNNKGYSLRNCKWATYKEQNRNSRHNRTITYQNKTQCLIAWAEQLKLHENMLGKRLNKYPPQIAFNM